MKYTLSAFVVAALAFAAPAGARDALDPTTASAGVAFEASALDREITLSAGVPLLDVNADGAVAGINAHVQTGAFFRGELRALTGDLDFETNIGETTKENTFLEARGTVGTEAGGGRVYTGAGVTYQTVDFSGLDWNTTTLYVPVGFAKANRVGEAWTARTTIEGRVSVAGEEELEDVPTVGNVTFDHGVGFGARFDMTFQHDSGFAIGGFVETVQPGDTDEEFGTLKAEEISNSRAGIHVGWMF